MDLTPDQAALLAFLVETEKDRGVGRLRFRFGWKSGRIGSSTPLQGPVTAFTNAWTEVPIDRSVVVAAAVDEKELLQLGLLRRVGDDPGDYELTELADH